MKIPAGKYDLVILDALYRAEPASMNENDNSSRMRLYNTIDAIAARMDCGWVNIHHASKGDQSSKAVTDVGAGAGSQSRAADTHIILRPHEEERAFVLEVAVRSFAPVKPLALRWEFPVWLSAEDLDPAQLKGRKTRQQERQRDQDIADTTKILKDLQDGPKTEARLRTLIGAGRDRTQRLLGRLESEKSIRCRRQKVNGGMAKVYELLTMVE